MGTFSKIERDYWQDDLVLKLTPEEKYFYLYLLTNGRVNALGCYELRMKIAVVETGYNDETIAKHIRKFEELGKIAFDPATHEILIHNWGKYNWTRKTATVNTIKKDLKAVKSGIFSKLLRKRLAEIGILEREQPREELPLSFSDFGNNEEQEGITGESCSVEREIEIEKRYMAESDPMDEDNDPMDEDKPIDFMFATFWDAYPNKKKKAYAKTIWKRLKVNEALFAKMMAGLIRARESQEWAKDNGAYIPHPSSWLNGGCWEDEYRPIVKAGEGGGNDLERRKRLAGIGGEDHGR